MKAAVLVSAKKIEIHEISQPSIDAGEVLVKVKACGICGTDLHAYMQEGLYPKGTIFGHECAGVVTTVGSNVTNVKVGDRVVIQPAPGCGECQACLNGHDNRCDELNIGSTLERPGACADFVKVDGLKRSLFVMPETLTFEQGALIEPLATSLHAVRQSCFKAGDIGVVLGAGPIGLGVIQCLKLAGARKIIAVEISPERSELARLLGADEVLNPVAEGSAIFTKAISMADGSGAHVVYECTGVPAAFSTAVDYLRDGGQVMSIGVIEKDTVINPLNFILKEAQLNSSMCYTDEEFSITIDMVNQGRLNTDLMITDTISLDEIEEKGMRRLMSSTSAIKILVKP